MFILGVYLASNIGSKKAPFWIPFLATSGTVPLQYVLVNRRTAYIIVCVVVSSFVSGRYSRWCTKKRPSTLIGHLKVFGCLLLAFTAYCSLWASNLYFNMKVQTLGGKMVSLFLNTHHLCIIDYYQNGPFFM